ncbi:MAG: TonB family protein [Gammaproteobacteria bacterium]|nr:TonB family protein [Gammaproteobacteria bacterium]
MQAVMTGRAPAPTVTPSDRLALTLCLAVIVHTMVLLGVSFAPEPAPRRQAESLEITLVTQQSPTAPKQPDLLAQVNAEGGGDSELTGRPATPLAAPLPAPIAALAVIPPPPAKPHTDLQDPPLDPLPPRPVPQTVAQAAKHPAATTENLVKPVPVANLPTPSPAAERTPEPPAPDASPPTLLPTAAQLITRSFAMASLSAELEQKLDDKSKRPRLKFISASTQEYRYASYLEAWRQKVENIGNLNYPDEARKRKLSGNLLLDVALKPDGSVVEVIVRKSSGFQVLDDAAVRIVELAAPYAQFPDDIRHDVDVLHITRTWKFLSNEHFIAQ